MKKSSIIEQPLLEVIERRKSSRAYADRKVEPEKIKALFEAARWAPSSSNEQPWVYIYATKDQSELWTKIFSTLVEGNRIWADRAHLLIMAIARKNFIANDKPNGSAKYDLGAANAFLSLQATELGLNVHQMGGFNRETAKTALNIPDTHEAVVVMAIGYPGDVEMLAENFKLRELAPRERYVQDSFVMNTPF
jgi:nitroreductase